jgi:hypothetical protein
MDPENKDNKPIKSLRTYQGDVEEVLSKTKSSAATIMLAEQKKREISPIIIERPKNLAVRNKTFVVTSISLLVLGAIIAGSVYYIKSNEKVEVEMSTRALIAFSNESKIPLVNLNRETLLNRINSENEAFGSRVDSVLYLNVTKGENGPAEVQEVLSLLAPQMPGELLRSFDGEYMIGIYSFDTNEPFIILTTKEFPIAYSGMLRWEKNIISDLGRIFRLGPRDLRELVFSDETIKNKDLRILRNNDQKSFILYSFIDKNTLVITSNEKIYNAIIGKFLISKQIR